MTDYPDPPRSDWNDLALPSEADNPEDYEDLWGVVLDQENFEKLDQETILSGTYAERPSSAPYDGAKYHATDVNAVFVWDDSAGEWNVLNSGTEDDPIPGTTHLESVRTDGAVIGDTYHWASKYPGSDPDTRLDNALTAASDGDVIYLEADDYDADRFGEGSINKVLTISGTGVGVSGSATRIRGDWQLDGRGVVLECVNNISGGGDGDGEISIEGQNSSVSRMFCDESSGRGRLLIKNDSVTVSQITGGGNVTFDSGTSNGEIGLVADDVSVTDNGNNRIL